MRSTLLASTLLLLIGLVGCENAKKTETPEPPAVTPAPADKGAMEGKPAMDGPATTAPAEEKKP